MTLGALIARSSVTTVFAVRVAVFIDVTTTSTIGVSARGTIFIIKVTVVAIIEVTVAIVEMAVAVVGKTAVEETAIIIKVTIAVITKTTVKKTAIIEKTAIGKTGVQKTDVKKTAAIIEVTIAVIGVIVAIVGLFRPYEASPVITRKFALSRRDGLGRIALLYILSKVNLRIHISAHDMNN